ncbi:hypothetical protein MSHRCOH1_05750 [Candidatus Ornithobacterium hominis]|uniref:hypothetical protein n=1 Tax=Candidatus Ornithobacterium hominis TaxID=2497989 RepID=UPI0024BD34D2|nr:hypothetical protein [Candidatus Ornithobacterium hominis]CAI9429697.1 hypothetical protein MSHRCOH1_05750 [Candidatus Ornithobacterium hominis]
MTEVFNQAIRKIAKSKINATVGKVVEVNGNVCKVERDGNLSDLEDVRLQAIEGNFDSGLLVVPAIGSEVLCLVVDGEEQETAIVQTTEVERIFYKVKGAEFEMADGRLKFLTESENLKALLNDLIDDLKLLCDYLKQTATKAGAAQVIPLAEAMKMKFENVYPTRVSNLLNE